MSALRDCIVALHLAREFARQLQTDPQAPIVNSARGLVSLIDRALARVYKTFPGEGAPASDDSLPATQP